MQAFEIDDQTKEPFLRLGGGLHSDIILTPPRAGDADAITTLLNDPRVYSTLEGPPYPYERGFAVEWLDAVKTVTDQVWSAIQQAPKSASAVYGASPVRIIRQINEDGTQTFLGDCGIDRWGYPDIEDLQERGRLTAENEARPIGDECIVWTIGGRWGFGVGIKC